MAISSNTIVFEDLDSANEDLDFSNEDSLLNDVVDANLTEFKVLPRRSWVWKLVQIQNNSDVTIAIGILRNLRMSHIPGIDTPLDDTHVAI